MRKRKKKRIIGGMARIKQKKFKKALIDRFSEWLKKEFRERWKIKKFCHRKMGEKTKE